MAGGQHLRREGGHEGGHAAGSLVGRAVSGYVQDTGLAAGGTGDNDVAVFLGW